jgi:hypothetical protein
MPDLFGFKDINYWQSFRLIIITGILFGGGSGMLSVAGL